VIQQYHVQPLSLFDINQGYHQTQIEISTLISHVSEPPRQVKIPVCCPKCKHCIYRVAMSKEVTQVVILFPKRYPEYQPSFLKRLTGRRSLRKCPITHNEFIKIGSYFIRPFGHWWGKMLPEKLTNVSKPENRNLKSIDAIVQLISV
jgi:hypothetical protein